jgi:hypothetical protein
MAERQMIPWTDYLIPLPQEIEVPDPVRIAADQIGLRVTSRRDAQLEETVRWIEEILPIESAVLLAMNDLADMADAVRNDDALQLGKAPGLEEFLDEESFEERIRAAERCTALAEEATEPIGYTALQFSFHPGSAASRGCYRRDSSSAGVPRNGKGSKPTKIVCGECEVERRRRLPTDGADSPGRTRRS